MQTNLITMKEAAALLGCTWQTVRYYITAGKLKGFQINATPANGHPRWVVERAEVEALAAMGYKHYSLKDSGILTLSQAAAMLGTTTTGIKRAAARGLLEISKINVECVRASDVERLKQHLSGLISQQNAAILLGISLPKLGQMVEAGYLHRVEHPFDSRAKMLSHEECRELMSSEMWQNRKYKRNYIDDYYVAKKRADKRADG